MEYTKLGNSDVTVSRICLGCMGFGEATAGGHTWTLNESDSRDVIKYALDNGITFFDTAMAYSAGTSEMFVGKALNDFAKRDEVAVATKFFPRTAEEIEKGVSGQEHVMNMLDGSLKRLGMDYVDLYILHMWDYNTPIEETLEGFNNAVKAGKVRAIGVSNCYAWQLAKANAVAEKLGYQRFDSIQGHYNLIMREEEREMAPLCYQDNISMTPYSALAAGRLSRLPGSVSTKRLEQDTYAKFKYDQSEEQDDIIIKRVDEVAKKYGCTMTEISLAWLLTKVTSPVVGATKMHHIDGAVNAVNIKLADEDIAYLEEPYVPHKLSGVMAQNKPKVQVW